MWAAGKRNSASPWRGFARPEIVNGTRNQLFSSSSLTGNQNGRSGSRDLLDLIENLPNGVAFADDFLILVIQLNFRTQILRFDLKAVFQLLDFLVRVQQVFLSLLTNKSVCQNPTQHCDSRNDCFRPLSIGSKHDSGQNIIHRFPDDDWDQQPRTQSQSFCVTPVHIGFRR